MVVPLCDTGTQSGIWVQSKNASANEEEDYYLLSVKGKLSTFIPCSEHRDKIQAEVCLHTRQSNSHCFLLSSQRKYS